MTSPCQCCDPTSDALLDFAKHFCTTSTNPDCASNIAKLICLAENGAGSIIGYLWVIAQAIYGFNPKITTLPSLVEGGAKNILYLIAAVIFIPMWLIAVLIFVVMAYKGIISWATFTFYIIFTLVILFIFAAGLLWAVSQEVNNVKGQIQTVLNVYKHIHLLPK